MAAQYRLSCPVRCAAISPGPILPTSPKPPQARRPAERRPRTYFHYRVSFPHITLANPLTFTAEQPLVLRSWCWAQSVIMQNEPNFQARPPAERRPRTYFRCRVRLPHITLANPLTFTAEQPLVLRSWCGAKRMILQNKPNLQKCETNRNLCPERTYETATAHNSRKNKANLQKCKNEPNPLSTDDL